MKNLYLIVFAILMHYTLNACSIIPVPFCQSYSSSSVIVSGEIISIDSLGIDLEIIEVIQGEETRDIVRIWNGIDFECNGIWSLAASTIGELNDSVVIVLPMIDEILSEWDVIGDYRRPGPYSFTPELKFKNGMVNGFISGDIIAPPEYNVLDMDYESFKEIIAEDSDCTSFYLNINDVKMKSTITVNNPFTSSLNIQMDDTILQGNVKIYTMNGRLVYNHNIINQESLEIESSGFQDGMYFMEIRDNGEILDVIKLIKQ